MTILSLDTIARQWPKELREHLDSNLRDALDTIEHLEGERLVWRDTALRFESDLNERSFNAGFDAVGVAMKVPGFRLTHPQWIRDRKAAFLKAASEPRS